MPDGSMQQLPVTDKHGLPCDPLFYAKSSCKACLGRGVRSITNLVTLHGTNKVSRPGPNLLRCGCVDREYEKVVAQVLALTEVK